MRLKWLLISLILGSLIYFSTSCEEPGPLIESITADNPVLKVGESTVLRCYVYNPTSGELTFGWRAEAGRVISYGDTAEYTAPDTLAADSLFWVSVTVSDEWGRTDEDSISLAVSTPPMSLP